MGRLESRRWAEDLTGPTRSDRSPCAYEVYMPDLLAGRRFTLDGDVAVGIASAEPALSRLGFGHALTDGLPHLGPHAAAR